MSSVQPDLSSSQEVHFILVKLQPGSHFCSLGSTPGTRLLACSDTGSRFVHAWVPTVSADLSGVAFINATAVLVALWQKQQAGLKAFPCAHLEPHDGLCGWTV